MVGEADCAIRFVPDAIFMSAIYHVRQHLPA